MCFTRCSARSAKMELISLHQWGCGLVQPKVESNQGNWSRIRRAGGVGEELEHEMRVGARELERSTNLVMFWNLINKRIKSFVKYLGKFYC